MPRRPSNELKALLSDYDPSLVDLALEARKAVMGRAGNCWELIYQTYAVSTAFSFTDELKHAFCHVAVYKKHVNLGFNRGTELADLAGLLQGTGRLIRHLRLGPDVDLNGDELSQLIDAALDNMRERMAERGETRTRGAAVVKSIRA